MNFKQGGFCMSFLKQWSLLRIFVLSVLLLGQVSWVHAEELALSTVDYNALSGDNLQLSFQMTGDAVKPKVFHTDSPARVVLDFVGVKSNLKQKKNIINAGGINSFFAIESAGRLRIVINLKKLVAYDVNVEGSQVIVGFHNADVTTKASHKKLTEKTLTQFAGLIPHQEIDKIDFRRGKQGEGRLFIYLTNPDTVVNTYEKAGKIELNFLNTSLSKKYAKKMDVLDFATPVSMIEAKSVGSRVKVLVTPVNSDYVYSSFQSDGLLTLEIREVTTAEEKAKRKSKFPYTGERLSLNFQDIEIRSVLQILADFTDINILASDSVTGNLTLRLNNVPWDQALEFILKSKGLAKRQAGNVILVAPSDEIRRLEEEEIESQKVVERLEPLVTEYIQINFAKAQNFKNILYGKSSMGTSGCAITEGSEDTGTSGSGGSGGNINSEMGEGIGNAGGGGSNNGRNSLLSERGTAIVDLRTNTLIVKDTAKNLEEVAKMIQILDKPVRQVLIEARIVVAEEGFAQDLGAKFGAAYVGNKGSAGATTGSNPYDQLPGDLVTPVFTNLAAANPYGALGMTLASGANYVLNLEISALQDDRKAEFVSNPRVLTSDRCSAKIEQGIQIPYQTTSQNGTRTIFKHASIILEATPQITPSGNVIMDLHITKDSPGVITPGGVAINKRAVSTSVQIQDGETIVLGGVYEGNTVNEVNSVPWFSDLPLVGWMFRKTLESSSKKELLIFITPKIVKESMKML